MEKIIKFLFKLNNKLYNLKFHTPILIIWIWTIINFNNLISMWFKVGLVIWVGLLIFRFYQDRSIKKHLKFHWKTFKENGILPYVVGLNITVVFGLLSIPLVFLVSKYSK